MKRIKVVVKATQSSLITKNPVATVRELHIFLKSLFLFIYVYWSTDLEPKVPLPDCASRFLRLAFFLELSSPKDLRKCFTVKRNVPLSLAKKCFHFDRFSHLCVGFFKLLSQSKHQHVTNLTSPQPIKQPTRQQELLQVIGSWQNLISACLVLIGWDVGTQQKDVKTVEWEWYDAFHKINILNFMSILSS